MRFLLPAVVAVAACAGAERGPEGASGPPGVAGPPGSVGNDGEPPSFEDVRAVLLARHGSDLIGPAGRDGADAPASGRWEVTDADGVTLGHLVGLQFAPGDQRFVLRTEGGVLRDSARQAQSDAGAAPILFASATCTGQRLVEWPGLPWMVRLSDGWYETVLTSSAPERIHARLGDGSCVETSASPPYAMLSRLEPQPPDAARPLFLGRGDE